jgi:hypothetical protein
MLDRDKIIDLLKKHVTETECKASECLCQKAIDDGVALTRNDSCGWEVKEAALSLNNPDPDVIVGVHINRLEVDGWVFTLKPDYKKDKGIIHTGKPPMINASSLSQVIFGVYKSKPFIIAYNRGGWMLGEMVDCTSVDEYDAKVREICERVVPLEDHDIADDVVEAAEEILS